MKEASHHKLIPHRENFLCRFKIFSFSNQNIHTEGNQNFFITYSVENSPPHCFSIFTIHSYPVENRGSEYASLSRKTSNRSSVQNVQIVFNYRVISSNIRVIYLLCKHYTLSSRCVTNTLFQYKIFK